MSSASTLDSSVSISPEHNITKSDSTDSSKLSTLLLSPSDLSSQPALLSQLRDIINEAYKGTHLKLEKDLGVDPNSIFPGFRLDDEYQLVRELPENSRLAIMFDEEEEAGEILNQEESRDSLDNSSASHHYHDKLANTPKADGERNIENGTSAVLGKQAENKKVVAVASIKKWQGPVMYKHYRSLISSNESFPVGPQYPPKNMIDDTTRLPDKSQNPYYWDWEIATCASVEDKKYRGMGLVSRLTGMLIDELKEKRMAYLKSHTSAIKSSIEVPEKQESDIMHSQTDNTSETPATSPKIRLWVSALGGSYNVLYWQKRGFTIQGDGPDTAPPGVWDNAIDVQIWTLNKVLED